MISLPLTCVESGTCTHLQGARHQEAVHLVSLQRRHGEPQFVLQPGVGEVLPDQTPLRHRRVQSLAERRGVGQRGSRKRKASPAISLKIDETI